MSKCASVMIAAAMVLVSFSLLVSFDAAPEDITGPFMFRDTGYPSTNVVLDAEQIDADYSNDISSINWCYQTFKPTTTGVLDHISVDIADSAGIGYIDVFISNTDQAGNLLGGITSASFDSFIDGWWDINFVTSPTLSDGIEYAIIFSSPSSRSISWYAYGSDLYPDGSAYTSGDGGGSWFPAGADQTFQVYLEIPTGGIKKVAWHESGGQAWGVTGDSEIIYAYSRDVGTWAPVYSAVPGDIFHDIVYDHVRHMFYIVGESSGWPIMFTWDVTNGFLDRGSPPIMGAFYGVEPCYGYGDYYFLAVGRNSANQALAVWYDIYGTSTIIGGFYSGTTTLYDATWDYQTIGSYFMVGTNTTSGTAAFYMCDNAGSTNAQDIIGYFNPADYYSFAAIDWCPDHATNDYAIIVGSGPNAAAWMLETGTPSLIPLNEGYSGTLSDVNWFPDGAEAVIVGEDGGSGIVYTHIAGTDEVKDSSFLLPSGTGPLHGVACKGPSSPSSAIITGASGSASFYPSALNQDTKLTVNAVTPKLYSIDFINTALASRLDQPVSVDKWYNFTLVANYSQGWTNCEIEVRAWHDGGAAPGAYPPEIPSTRNSAFRLIYWPWNSTYMVMYPAPELEVTAGTETDTALLVNPGIEDHHEVYLPIYFGSQLAWGDGSGWITGDPAWTNKDPNPSLQDPNSWNFNVTVRDRLNPTAVNSSYAEFGVEKLVSIAVTGNPSGSAPPGTADAPMTGTSNVYYSSNTRYWVNVSISHLYLNGVVGPTYIGAENVSCQNINPLANSVNSYIAGPGTPRYFPETEYVYMNVWGLNGTSIPPVGNGTVSAGPWVSDYNAGGLGYNDWTEVQWWVTITATVAEGVYIATITMTVDG